MASNERSVGPWILGGCAVGCFGLALLIVAGGVIGTRWARGLAEQLDDPERAGERAAESLGVETLPEGYEPKLAFSIPFVGDFVLLDGPTRAGADPADPDARWQFFYMDVRSFDEAPPVGSGDVPDARLEDVLEQRGIQIETGTVIDRGRREGARQTVHYLTALGRARQGGSDREGVIALAEIRCRSQADSRFRLGMFTVDHPEAVREGAFDPEGTPAAPDRLEAFFESLGICPAGG